MKRLSRLSTTKLCKTLLLCALAALPLGASAERDPVLDAMSNDELITSLPAGKHAQAVRDAQGAEARRLFNGVYSEANGFNVETYRAGEVIIITIPAAKLFVPNSDELMAGADKILAPLKKYAMASKPDFFRMLLVMHTDDTGSAGYTDALSLKRVQQVFDEMARQGFDTSYIFPTAAGATDPLFANDTQEGRAKNRRLEVYLIPGKGMLDAAKKVVK